MVVTIEAPKAVDPKRGAVIFTVGLLESRIGCSTFWILPQVWVSDRITGTLRRKYFLDAPWGLGV